jgi:ribosomal-protein-serine acetyltransferase
MSTLRTERLVLTPTHPDLFEGIWRAVERSLAELRLWMPWAVEPDPEKTLAFVRDANKQWEVGLERNFTLLYEAEVCGHCSLDHPDPLNHNYEIGYWMRSDLCGRGLTTEGARAVIDFAFEELGTHRIELHAGTVNKASIRVAEKLGFQREGVLREAGWGANGFHDQYVYGLLARDRHPR